MIVTSGETVMDFFAETTAEGATVFRPVPGGSLFNVALGAARLGAPTGYLWAISDDLFGAPFAALLQEAGVDPRWIARTARHGTVAFVDNTGPTPAFTLLDEGSAGRLFDPQEMPPLGPQVSILHTGSYVLATEPVGSRLEALIEREAPNRLISLDINIRPGLIEDAAAYRARLARLIGRASIVKASEEDLGWFAPGRSPLEVAEGWIAGGASLAVVTLGGDGALAVCREAVAQRPGRRVTVVDTVGAGDTFMAGLLAGLHHRGLVDRARLDALTLSDIATLTDNAIAAAAIVCSRRGCALPWRHEVAEFA
ncbi:carbohydrate kinase [Pseudoxanthobacter sp.]|uniref:carbohydrate kinase family protein n=1 Tax=Pseudoxanthobacter sp. TaxID=1925742 RepID=UPI002FE33138